jgi:hypothetical protein
MVTVNGTRVEGDTKVNGMLNAADSNFLSLNVNGNTTLYRCTVNQSIVYAQNAGLIHYQKNNFLSIEGWIPDIKCA